MHGQQKNQVLAALATADASVAHEPPAPGARPRCDVRLHAKGRSTRPTRAVARTMQDPAFAERPARRAARLALFFGDDLRPREVTAEERRDYLVFCAAMPCRPGGSAPPSADEAEQDLAMLAPGTPPPDLPTLLPSTGTRALALSGARPGSAVEAGRFSLSETAVFDRIVALRAESEPRLVGDNVVELFPEDQPARAADDQTAKMLQLAGRRHSEDVVKAALIEAGDRSNRSASARNGAPRKSGYRSRTRRRRPRPGSGRCSRLPACSNTRRTNSRST